MKKVYKIPLKKAIPGTNANNLNSDISKFYKDFEAVNQNPNAQLKEYYPQEQGYDFKEQEYYTPGMISNNIRLKNLNSGLGELSTFNDFDNVDMNPRSRFSLESGNQPENQYYYDDETPTFGDYSSKALVYENPPILTINTSSGYESTLPYIPPPLGIPLQSKPQGPQFLPPPIIPPPLAIPLQSNPQGHQFMPPPNLQNIANNPIPLQTVYDQKPPPLNLVQPPQNIDPSGNYNLPYIPQVPYDINNQLVPTNPLNIKNKFAKQPEIIPSPPSITTPIITTNLATINMPPPIITLTPIQIKDFFIILKESTCLVCNDFNPNFLSSCKHLYHINCIKKLKSSKCVKCSEVIENEWFDIPLANNCHNCSSTFNLLSCNDCNKKSCVSCILLRNLQGCCGNLEKNKIKLCQQCPGCFYDRSICDLVLNTCVTHNFLCKKCWNLSTRIGKCILGCELGIMGFPDIIRCPECYEFEIKYFGEYLCPDSSCEDCEKCMAKRYTRIPECTPYCMCTEPMDKKNIEKLWT
ncbi:hypothetical protein SteCoe_1103 [Stentor coeruleus]|uniref:RING-type domain-containing protein n=1 Tax=Stentor coeruleus TaxID=5963 RepID=A0A1R2D2R8_9CILI|nr:hypothetical protein SteCoe_1103 [Stentor coeruleus]